MIQNSKNNIAHWIINCMKIIFQFQMKLNSITIIKLVNPSITRNMLENNDLLDDWTSSDSKIYETCSVKGAFSPNSSTKKYNKYWVDLALALTVSNKIRAKITAWAIKLICSNIFHPNLSANLRNIGDPIVNPMKNIAAKDAI